MLSNLKRKLHDWIHFRNDDTTPARSEIDWCRGLRRKTKTRSTLPILPIEAEPIPIIDNAHVFPLPLSILSPKPQRISPPQVMQKLSTEKKLIARRNRSVPGTTSLNSHRRPKIKSVSIWKTTRASWRLMLGGSEIGTILAHLKQTTLSRERPIKKWKPPAILHTHTRALLLLL